MEHNYSLCRGVGDRANKNQGQSSAVGEAGRSRKRSNSYYIFFLEYLSTTSPIVIDPPFPCTMGSQLQKCIMLQSSSFTVIIFQQEKLRCGAMMNTVLSIQLSIRSQRAISKACLPLTNGLNICPIWQTMAIYLLKRSSILFKQRPISCKMDIKLI